MSANDRPEISLVCLAYNEIATLELVIREYKEWFLHQNLTHEIIIIDDGSSDGSSEVADRLAEIYPEVRVIHHECNVGLGHSFREGYEQFRGQWLSFTSTDRQFPCTVMDVFLPLRADYDLILGYVRPQNRGLVSLFLSHCERLLIRTLFGPMPKFQGNFLVRRSVIEAMNLTSRGRGWMIQMEMIIRAIQQGVRITSVLTELSPREHGTSRATSLRSVVSNLRQVCALYWQLRCKQRKG